MLSSTILLLAAANTAQAQVTTASIVPVGFNEHGVQGQVVGTGAEGTTFVLSATMDAVDVPYTMTLVQDVSHISKGGLVITSTITIPYNVQCDLQVNGEAVCTEVFNSGTITETRDIFLIGVPVSTGRMSGAFPGTFTATGETTPIATRTNPTIISNPSGGDLPTTGGGIFPSSEGGGTSPPLGGDDGGLLPSGSRIIKHRLSTLGLVFLIMAASLMNL